MSVTGALASTVLKPAGPDKSVGIITASAGLDPSDPQWNDNPDIKAFRYLLQNFYPEGDQNSALAFLDYSIADVFFQVVRRCGDDLSRAHLVESYRMLRACISLPCSPESPFARALPITTASSSFNSFASTVSISCHLMSLSTANDASVPETSNPSPGASC